ncbi:MAG TPA: HAD family hydrolase [Thermomicrobiales bacterium]|jgi:HAD superfamily hydrolase (TIGR01509 family)|nr:HAD family hydrolase [Thermomicrobiales bacterium]
MNGQAITFDFHNTLASCPEWFELEVRRLPSSFLQWWTARDGRQFGPAQLDEADARYRQLRHEIMEHGNELTAEACLEQVFGAMRLQVPKEDVRTGVANLMHGALAGASPIPGAVTTVREIHRAGVQIGIVSSAVFHPFLEWTLESFGIRDAFDVVITSASAGFYKSRAELYVHAAELLGATPDRMVHVGDSFRFDVAGARRAGMGTVWLRRDQAESDDPSIRPDLVLTTLEAAAPEILMLLRSRSPDSDEADV